MLLHRLIWGLVFVMSIYLTCWSSVALAQRAEDVEENSVIKVFSLSNATAHQMADLIDNEILETVAVCGTREAIFAFGPRIRMIAIARIFA